MSIVNTGINLTKSVFAAHGVGAAGKAASISTITHHCR